jgi:hypothetical protein
MTYDSGCINVSINLYIWLARLVPSVLPILIFDGLLRNSGNTPPSTIPYSVGVGILWVFSLASVLSLPLLR